jgi:polyketide biosynthesis enoyl-CoA hydratase PksH
VGIVSYETLQVRFQDAICFVQINRPQANNTINQRLIAELTAVVEVCERESTIVVLSGLPEVFCFGADFKETQSGARNGAAPSHGPEALYDLWLKLATGPFISIAHVRGKTNAGGIGFVAASDLVLADETATFSLSELLFGLIPACVLPFLIRRAGFQKAHYLTLMTQPVPVQQAHAWGLVDAWEPRSEALLHKHLLRLRRLSKTAVTRYKRYMAELGGSLEQARQPAIAVNRTVFSDPRNLEGIVRYVEKGLFPWEAERV